MTELHPRDLLTVIVDPDHERFGQVGRSNLMSDYEGDGDSKVTFDDGQSEMFNDGARTGLPQFTAIPKAEQDKVDHLVAALPDLRPILAEMRSKAGEPVGYPYAPEMAMARRSFRALIHQALSGVEVGAGIP